MKKLGMLVNTEKHLKHVINICKAARKLNIDVSVFVIDDGCFLLKNPEFTELLRNNVKITVCDYSCREKKKMEGRVDGIVYGSQYEHALIAHECDRFLVF